MIYIHNNVWKFCGDHILIKFFFGWIIDIQKNFKKKRREPASLKVLDDHPLRYIGASFENVFIIVVGDETEQKTFVCS